MITKDDAPIIKKIIIKTIIYLFFQATKAHATFLIRHNFIVLYLYLD